MYIIFVVLLFLTCWCNPFFCAPSNLWVPQDSWDGTYTCIIRGYNNAPISMIVNSYDSQTQRVVVQVVQGTPYGQFIYLASGTADGNDLDLKAGTIIKKPNDNLLALDFSGEVSSDGNTYSGDVRMITCESFKVKRTRSTAVYTCGLNITKPGTYSLTQDILSTQRISPCITVAADNVTINTTNFKIDAGDCSNCTGIMIYGSRCSISKVELVNFAVGIALYGTNAIIKDVIVRGTRVLDSAIGIASNSNASSFQNIYVQDLVSNSNVFGVYLDGASSLFFGNLKVNNLTSINPPGLGSVASVGIYATRSQRLQFASVAISQITAYYRACGVSMANSSNLYLANVAISSITATNAGANASGLYSNENTDVTCVSCNVTMVSANASGTIASGFALEGYLHKFGPTVVSFVSGATALGIVANGTSQSNTLSNFSISNINGAKISGGIYAGGADITFSWGSIRRISSSSFASGVVVPSASQFTLGFANISIVQAPMAYGIYLHTVLTPLIYNTSILQILSNINVFLDDPTLAAVCSSATINATQVCYPYSSQLSTTCCSSCHQVQTPDECEGQCSNSTCQSGYECVISQLNQPECKDINECVDYQVCGPGYSCTNLVGSYECEDEDECAENKCGSGYNCTNVPGDYSCKDFNECTEQVCGVGYSCVNLPGSFRCDEDDLCASVTCLYGFACSVSNKGSAACFDVDECLDPNKCPTGFYCNNTEGSFECEDVNECTTGQCPSNYLCTNTWGSFYCVVAPPTFKSFTYVQSSDSPSHANFSWRFEAGSYPIDHYLFIADETPGNTTIYVMSTPSFIEYWLSVGTKFTFRVFAVDSQSSRTQANSTIVIKNQISQLACNYVACMNNGTCGPDGLCHCLDGWTGPYCNSKTDAMTVRCDSKVPRAIMNDTTTHTYINITMADMHELNEELQEIEGTRIDMTREKFGFIFKRIPNGIYWLYNSTLSNGALVEVVMIAYNTTTEVPFAGSTLTVLPNTLKLDFTIAKWPFVDKNGKLALTMDISFLGHLGDLLLDNPDAMNWLSFNVGNTNVFVYFMDTAVIDGRVESVDFVWNGDGTVTVHIPYFEDYAEIDPNFNVLVQGNNGENPWDSKDPIDKQTAIIIGVVLGGLFLVLLVFIIFRKPIITRVQVALGANKRKVTIGSEDSADL